VDLLTSEKEMESLFNLVNEISEQSSSLPSASRVTFQEDGTSVLMDFLSCFDVGNVGSLNRCISLRKDKSDDNVKRVAMTMFQKWLHAGDAMSEWLTQAEASGIHAQSLLVLALHFWLQMQHKSPPNVSMSTTLATDMLQLNSLLSLIQSLAGNF